MLINHDPFFWAQFLREHNNNTCSYSVPMVVPYICIHNASSFCSVTVHFISDHCYNNRFTTLCPGLSGSPGTRRNIYPPTILIIRSLSSFFHLLQSIKSSTFKFRAWQSFCTTSLHVLFGLESSTSYPTHFFTQSVSSFHSTCPYHRNLFCCSINIISSIPSLSLNSLLGTLSFTLTLHIQLTILISNQCFCYVNNFDNSTTWHINDTHVCDNFVSQLIHSI